MKTDPGRSPISKLDRRASLRLSGVAGGGLMLGIVTGCSPEPGPEPEAERGGGEPFKPNAFLQISAQGIVIYAPNP